MVDRCANPSIKKWHRYGGRGITVCDEWKDYQAFKAWANANGYADHLEIDRRDNDGNYEPGNCRWVTHLVNTRNRSCVKLDETKADEIRVARRAGVKGKELAKRYGVSITTIYMIGNGKMWKPV